jgi:hypothetical protein
MDSLFSSAGEAVAELEAAAVAVAAEAAGKVVTPVSEAAAEGVSAERIGQLRR